MATSAFTVDAVPHDNARIFAEASSREIQAAELLRSVIRYHSLSVLLFKIELRGQKAIISGRVRTFYARQLLLKATQGISPGLVIEDRIEVD